MRVMAEQFFAGSGHTGAKHYLDVAEWTVADCDRIRRNVRLGKQGSYQNNGGCATLVQGLSRLPTVKQAGTVVVRVDHQDEGSVSVSRESSLGYGHHHHSDKRGVHYHGTVAGTIVRIEPEAKSIYHLSRSGDRSVVGGLSRREGAGDRQGKRTHPDGFGGGNAG